VIAFGIVGPFIGPVILAVTFKLFHAWIGTYGADAQAHRRPAGSRAAVAPPT
jgi:predicted PurR-regulated permease PerM